MKTRGLDIQISGLNTVGKITDIIALIKKYSSDFKNTLVAVAKHCVPSRVEQISN
jgi:hypothetical protein